MKVDDMPISEAQKIIDEIEETLRNYGITHVTVQLEADRCSEKAIICGERNKKQAT